MAFLIEFNFKVRHIKGKENKVADVLSRRAHGISEVILSQPKSDLLDKVKTTNTQDADYTKLLSEIRDNEIRLNGTAFKVDQKGLVWFNDRLYIPKSLEIKLFILNEMHKPSFAGHLGYQKMITTLRKQFFWLGLKSDLVEYLSV